MSNLKLVTTVHKPNRLYILWNPEKIFTTYNDPIHTKTKVRGKGYKKLVDVFRNIKSLDAAKRVIGRRRVSNILKAVYIDNNNQPHSLKIINN